MPILPAPKYGGFSLFRKWLDAPLKEKLRSFLGSLRRIIVRIYYKPLKSSEFK
jgi:coenzyme F420 hydrogenase subunit beta